MPASPEEPLDIERVLMDRARRLAERHDERLERPLLPRVVGLALALLMVVIVLFAFDRFLASMQRFLGLPIADPEPVLTEPLPAYVVPLEPGGDTATPGAGQDAQPRTAPRGAAGDSGTG